MARFSLADPLKLVLGARLTSYEKNARSAYAAPYAMKYDREVTPYAGIVYDLDDTYSAYASYTDIFQPQNLKDFSGNLLDPVVGKSYEAGIKGDYFGGRLNTSFARVPHQAGQAGPGSGHWSTATAAARLPPEAYYRAAAGASQQGLRDGSVGRPGARLEPQRRLLAVPRRGRRRRRRQQRLSAQAVARLHLLPAARRTGAALTVGGGVNWEGRTYTVDPAAPAGSKGLIEQDAFSLVNLMARYDISQAAVGPAQHQQRPRQEALRHVRRVRRDHLRRAAQRLADPEVPFLIDKDRAHAGAVLFCSLIVGDYHARLLDLDHRYAGLLTAAFLLSAA